MSHGTIDLEEILTEEQKEFYSTHRDFTIHALHFPISEETLILSFNKDVMDKSYFKTTFFEDFKIYFQKGYYEYIQQEEVHAIILHNMDIIVSSNLSFSFDVTGDPLAEEFLICFTRGQQLFKKVLSEAKMESLYDNIFTEQAIKAFQEIAFNYRLFNDDFLDAHFFEQIFRYYLYIRAALRKAFRKQRIPLAFRPFLIALFATHLGFDRIFQDEKSKKDPKFAFKLIKDQITLPQFANFLRIAHNVVYIDICRNEIDAIIKVFDINPIFKDIAFEIARRARLREQMRPEVRAACAIMITGIVLDYYKKINRFELARRHNITHGTQLNKIFSFLKDYGYDVNSKSIREDRTNIEHFKLLIKKDLGIHYENVENYHSLIRELAEIVPSDEITPYFERYFQHLIALIKNAKASVPKILSHLTSEEKEKIILSVLFRIKHWKGLEKEKGIRFLQLAEQLIEILEWEISLPYLFDKDVLF